VNHIYLVPSFTCNPSGLENYLHNGNARTNYMHCLTKLTVSLISMSIVTNGLPYLKESGRFCLTCVTSAFDCFSTVKGFFWARFPWNKKTFLKHMEGGKVQIF
jgi:hypothetical protein